MYSLQEEVTCDSSIQMHPRTAAQQAALESWKVVPREPKTGCALGIEKPTA